MAEKFTAEELRKFEKGWEEEMLEIWREKLIQYKIRHTGSLFTSLASSSSGEEVRTIVHRFLTYGIYVAMGVGRYYKNRENFEDYNSSSYRREHGLDKPRKIGPSGWGGGGYMTSGQPRRRRPWWSRKYYASLMKLNDVEGEFYGEMYRGVLFNVIKEEFSSALGSHKGSTGLQLTERLKESLDLLNS